MTDLKKRQATELLGGPGFTPATVEEKREFRVLCQKWPAVTQEELDRMQRIEWSLTYDEYQLLKFGRVVEKDETSD